VLHAQLDQAPFGRVQVGVQGKKKPGAAAGSFNNTSLTHNNRANARQRIISRP
jgi:hypothetical protein